MEGYVLVGFFAALVCVAYGDPDSDRVNTLTDICRKKYSNLSTVAGYVQPCNEGCYRYYDTDYTRVDTVELNNTNEGKPCGDHQECLGGFCMNSDVVKSCKSALCGKTLKVVDDKYSCQAICYGDGVEMMYMLIPKTNGTACTDGTATGICMNGNCSVQKK